MKKFLSLMAFAIAVIFTSCTKDKETEIAGTNELSIVFETSFNGEILNLDKEYTFKEDKLKIQAFDFIIGNIVLVDESGNEFIYPKEKSYFIVSKGGKKNKSTVDKIESIVLKDIPAGKYKTLKFGIGVDEETYKGGKQFANNLWERSEKYDLTWSWATGYKFLVLEGQCTEATATDSKPFKYHVASAANVDKYVKDKDLYKEFAIDIFTNSGPALVSNDKTPQIHLMVDAGKMLTNVKVSETPVLMGPKTKTISTDSKEMFTYEHTHYNDAKH